MLDITTNERIDGARKDTRNHVIDVMDDKMAGAMQRQKIDAVADFCIDSAKSGAEHSTPGGSIANKISIRIRIRIRIRIQVVRETPSRTLSIVFNIASSDQFIPAVPNLTQPHPTSPNLTNPP